MTNITRILSNKLVVFLIVLLVIFFHRFVNMGYESLLVWSSVWLILGLFFSLSITFFDRVIYAYLSHPEDEYSVRFKNLISEKKFNSGIFHLVNDQDKMRRLTTNNVLFMAVWVVLALFLITSSNNIFAKGLILGLGVSIGLDLYRDYSVPDQLIARLFWPIARKISAGELQVVVYSFWSVVAFCCLIVV